MVCILNTHTDPYFNAAAEEFLLKQFDRDCFMLWQNTASVFIGKHQNALAEINYGFIKQNNIPVIRRLSGGGTVFHDEGNLNFSFITHAEQGKSINFKFYLKPIVDFLCTIGITSEINPRNNLFIGDRKITGTAAHIYKNKVIHHGTLLYKTNEKNLLLATQNDANKYSDKSVKSVRSNITNISQHIAGINIHDFIFKLKDFLTTYFKATREYFFSKSDHSEIEKLSQNKYQTWEWNYGYSPAYFFQNKILIQEIETEIKLEVKKGIIESVLFTEELPLSSFIINTITGKAHKEDLLFAELNKIGLGYICRHLF